MAFTIATLNPIGGQSRASSTTGKGISFWTYTTDDAAATVDTAGYFNSASTLLKINDIILVATTAAGVVTLLSHHVVNANALGVVDVTDATVISATVLNDTD